MADGADRRRDLRVVTDLDCEVHHSDRGLPARVLDLSLGGAKVLVRAGLGSAGPGDPLVLTLRLGQRQLSLAANVVRRLDEGTVAVCFAGPLGPAEGLLARFVQDQYRKQLRTHLHLQV